ncbi:hypothetical protein V5E97_39690 [Singulisphaera sp. Ch08]|uniref:Transposase n=1 Tax=Singulisphaera sp. Ch08 TaxID=3120278 RepID=A0AAU7CFZ9_9BACT
MVIIVVERPGRFHMPVQAAGFEVRSVHPFATKQFRQPADPGNKTDDTDLSAIHRVAVNGFERKKRGTAKKGNQEPISRYRLLIPFKFELSASALRTWQAYQVFDSAQD